VPHAVTPTSNPEERFARFWPRGLPRTLNIPATPLNQNLNIAATRFPGKAAIIYFDTPVSYERLQREVTALAGFLQQRCGVSRGDRVILFGQSCPQFVVAYYAILRIGAAVVPINAMSTADEVQHYMDDCQARVAVVARELLPHIQALPLSHTVTFTYADYLEQPTMLPVPAWVRQTHATVVADGLTEWRDALAAALEPAPVDVGLDDMCVLPYTSGTTGRPKGCVHTHRSVMAAAWSAGMWRGLHSETVFLGVAPMFHMLGMQNGMNVPISLGATVIVTPRWDRELAAACIERYQVTAWTAPTAALVDFFANPDIDRYDLSSLTLVTGGGSPVPATVAQQLETRFGIVFNEGYGMSETASFLFCNPLGRQKVQCLGIPTFGVEALVIDPETLLEVAAGEAGEIIVRGNQVMQCYWNNAKGTADAFIEIGGKRYLRTGDLGRVDEDGYFFMTDRLKRMINVSGFKVWPAEVENRMYEHPSVLEACVVGVPDERQGEAVKAFVVLRPEARASVTESEIIAWARERMAVYKAPRSVAFVETFPRSSTGKILWRELR
jgi:fatty-acyl-CoA synthase